MPHETCEEIGLIIREYRCPDCGEVFEHFHASYDDPPLETHALCKARLEKLPSVFRTRGTALKAANAMYRIAEEDMGVTNMKDNLREGEVAAITKPLSPELEKMKREFFRPQGPSNTAAFTAPQQEMVALAKQATKQARAEGAPNPMEQLHRSFKATHARGVPINVIGRDSGK